MKFIQHKFLRLVMSVFVLVSCFSTNIVLASNITPEQPLEAQWLPNAVKITFDSNGGGDAPGEQIYTFGVERSLPGRCSMSKTGYQFIGWAESSTATAPDFEPGETSTEAFGYANAEEAIAKTLYAVWEADTTATSSQLLSGYTAYSKGSKITGNISAKSAQIYTPTTSNQTIASGQYLTGTQTIKGDSNLTSGNIKSGVSIFGVSGSYSGSTSKGVAVITSGSLKSDIPSSWSCFGNANGNMIFYSNSATVAILASGSLKSYMPSTWSCFGNPNGNMIFYSSSAKVAILASGSLKSYIPSTWSCFGNPNGNMIFYSSSATSAILNSSSYTTPSGWSKFGNPNGSMIYYS